MTKKSVTFTPENIHELFEIDEALNDIRENIAKYHAITEVFADALASSKNDDAFYFEETFFRIASALHDYSEKTLSDMNEAYNKYNQLYEEKKNLSYGIQEEKK